MILHKINYQLLSIVIIHNQALVGSAVSHGPWPFCGCNRLNASSCSTKRPSPSTYVKRSRRIPERRLRTRAMPRARLKQACLSHVLSSRRSTGGVYQVTSRVSLHRRLLSVSHFAPNLNNNFKFHSDIIFIEIFSNVLDSILSAYCGLETRPD